MKQIIDISLGSSNDDYEFSTTFLNQKFNVKRIGTNGDIEKAEEFLLLWNKRADAIALGGIKFPFELGSTTVADEKTNHLLTVGSKIKTPVTAGEALRDVGHEWTIRHLQFKFGNNYFNNARVLFLSGVVNLTMAEVLSEYTQNLTFIDPLYEQGLPKFLNSMEDLYRYAKGRHRIFNWIPSKKLSDQTPPVRKLNEYLIKQAVKKAFFIVVPFYDFYEYFNILSLEELANKVIITSTAYDNRVTFLKERGVDVIIDSTPKMLEQVVGVSVLEAMIIVTLNKPKHKITNDELLEIVSEQRMDPRVIYPSGVVKRTNRFAYVIHPLSKEDFSKIGPLDLVSKVTPHLFMGAVEKMLAYSPPFIYSKITGVKSPTGVEAEGWLITIGGTPKEMEEKGAEFTLRRLHAAVKMAEKLGAQIVGISPLTRNMNEVSLALAKETDIPITTGNSYIASATLWAVADAVRRMGLVKDTDGKQLKAKTMVIGATGDVGAICCRLLSKAFSDVYMVGRNFAKLLALQESMHAESPDVSLHIGIRAEKYISDMDVIILASSGASRVMDMGKLKPGCVIADVNRPLIMTPRNAERRKDVLIIASGEIMLPGDPEMKDIGLPPKVVYAGLAETIVLALEGLFEGFTVGSQPEWDKVRSVYRMGLKHGMKLAAISGITDLVQDEYIEKVKELAVKARKKEKKMVSKKN